MPMTSGISVFFICNDLQEISTNMTDIFGALIANKHFDKSGLHSMI